MALWQLFMQLDADRRRQVHLALCADALPAWDDYVLGKSAQLRYRDSVAGVWHQVDPGLPADALRSAHAGVDLTDVADRYLEPIAALQDDDLTFPDAAEFAYYAIYNCYSRYVRGEPIPDRLIVNQALAVHDGSEVTARLTRAINDISPG